MSRNHFVGNAYYRFSNHRQFEPDGGYPKKLAAWDSRIDRIDAAFQSQFRRTFLLKGQDVYEIDDSNYTVRAQCYKGCFLGDNLGISFARFYSGFRRISNKAHCQVSQQWLQDKFGWRRHRWRRRSTWRFTCGVRRNQILRFQPPFYMFVSSLRLHLIN